MTIATGARSQLTYVPETVWGTTPAVPAMVGVPYTAWNVNLTKEAFSDMSIRADRMERYSLHGNKSVSGDLDVNLSHTNFDVFLESALNSTFNTNVLKSGTTRKSLSMEAGSLDIGQYTVYKGVVVDKVAITVPSSGIVTAKFSLMGADSTISASPLDATITEPSAKAPYTHVAGTFNEGGSPIATLTGVTLNIDNGYGANYSLGNTVARDLTYGFAKVTGTATAYFEDAALVNKFINGTASSLDFTLTDGTNTLKFDLSNIKYTGATKQVSGQGPIVLNLPFTALYDGTDASHIVITRSV